MWPQNQTNIFTNQCTCLEIIKTSNILRYLPYKSMNSSMNEYLNMFVDLKYYGLFRNKYIFHKTFLYIFIY